MCWKLIYPLNLILAIFKKINLKYVLNINLIFFLVSQQLHEFTFLVLKYRIVMVFLLLKLKILLANIFQFILL